MTNESKIIISLASLMVISLAGAATSTMAWFATTRTATVNMTDVLVEHRGNRLAVEVSNGINDACGIESGTSGVTSMTNSSMLDSSSLSGTSEAITDISSDGKSFYRPQWVPDQEATATNPGQAGSIPLVQNSTDGIYHIQFGIKISNLGNVQSNVYLDGSTNIYGVLSSYDGEDAAKLAQKGIDANAAKATRVAIYSVASGKPSSLLTYWGEETDDNYTHLSFNKAHKDAYSGSDDALKAYARAAEAYKIVKTAAPITYDYREDGMEITNASKTHIGSFATLSSEDDYDDASNAFIATIPSSSYVYVYVSVWIEGTSKYATNDCIGGQVGVNLSFVSFDHA